MVPEMDIECSAGFRTNRTPRNQKLLAGHAGSVNTREQAVKGHKFKIGQLVNYLGRERASGVYQITQLSPPEGEAFQYRIKNVHEPHERVAKENELRSA
jgi:hypothetical protein